MKVEYLREFLALAQELNYTVAARKLFISQSTLSRHMQAMKHELGFSLLDATSHGVALTNYGKSALPVFRKMVKKYDSFLNRTLQLSKQVSGKLSIGLLYYFMDARFSGFLDHMRHKYPAVQIVTHAYQPQPLYDDLMQANWTWVPFVVIRASAGDPALSDRCHNGTCGGRQAGPSTGRKG